MEIPSTVSRVTGAILVVVVVEWSGGLGEEMWDGRLRGSGLNDI